MALQRGKDINYSQLIVKLSLMPPKIKNIANMRDDAVNIFYAGLQAVEPNNSVKKYCRLEGDNLFIKNKKYDLTRFNNLFIVGAGKATAPMASALEDILGNRIKTGIINVKYEHVTELNHIIQIEAGHPVPDNNGQKGAQAILDLVKDAGKDDLALCLVSGGGSALLPLPFSGLTLKDKQETTKVLLSCGATIHEINAIRKHTSMIKGGWLAHTAYPAELISLILSDVIGDDLDIIASELTVPDPNTFQDCVQIIKKYNILNKIPKAIASHIAAGVSGKVPETPKPGNPIFDNTHSLIIGSNFEAVIAAKRKAESIGYNTLILSSMIEGETRDVAQVHGAIAKEINKTGNPLPIPACILSGGETTVTLKGKGRGGRNQEFALATAIDIAGMESIVALSAGTDGTDGPTNAAGAIADTNTIKKALASGLDPNNFLSNNDSYNFFNKLGDLFITGPTNTNVMDLRIIIVS